MSLTSTRYCKKLDTPQAAEYLGLGKSTLEKFRAIGDGPVFAKVGKKVIYDTADLEAWFAARKTTGSSEVATTAA